MFYYLIHNSTIIKKDTLKNKNVTTLIYGTIVYILIHALIYVNKSIKDTLLRYFWVIFSVDIISIFLSTEISSEIQNHNFSKDTNFLKNDEEHGNKKRKKKRSDMIQREDNERAGLENMERKHVEDKERKHVEDKERKHVEDKERKHVEDKERKHVEDKERNSRKKKEKTKLSDEINKELRHVEKNPTKNREILSNSIQDLQRNRMEMDFKHKHKNINIQETQNILDEIDQNEEVENTKKVTFDIPDDTKSELSDGSDLEIDLESFEKSLLED
jgi:hypothetical protein